MRFDKGFVCFARVCACACVCVCVCPCVRAALLERGGTRSDIERESKRERGKEFTHQKMSGNQFCNSEMWASRKHKEREREREMWKTIESVLFCACAHACMRVCKKCLWICEWLWLCVCVRLWIM